MSTVTSFDPATANPIILLLDAHSSSPPLRTLGRNIYTGAVLSVPLSASKETGIDWYSFLERPRLPSPAAESLDRLRDKSILVTGAGGSIGSALSLELAKLHPRQLVLLDASEQALYRLQSSLSDASLAFHCKIVLGNVTDRRYLDEIFETHQPSFIFHAAAYKHVPLLEEHPLEAITNNALGTFTVVQCAKKIPHARMVLLSTDKAVAPINILGATKRIAELITLAGAGVVLRLGNVLGSEGSVSETFLRQISAGGPVTITDPDAERYFLTREEAVDLLLTSAIAAPDASLLVPHINQQNRVASLAEFLISTYSPEARPPIIFTGLRPGDKFREALYSSSEQPFLRDRCGHFEITGQTGQIGQTPDSHSLHSELMQLEQAARERNLARAMEIVLKLVPDYKPSESITKLAQLALQGTTQP
jgi:FlaA1/EpsC-like NDP-sugar epimerase